MNPYPDEDLTVEEILAADEFTGEPAGESLSARLDAIRHTTTDGGVRVTVDLHGKIVDLGFDHQAMKLRPDELATKVKQLADEATAAALAEGMAVLTDTPALAALAPATWASHVAS